MTSVQYEVLEPILYGGRPLGDLRQETCTSHYSNIHFKINDFATKCTLSCVPSSGIPNFDSSR